MIAYEAFIIVVIILLIIYYCPSLYFSNFNSLYPYYNLPYNPSAPFVRIGIFSILSHSNGDDNFTKRIFHLQMIIHPEYMYSMIRSLSRYMELT